MPWRIGTLQSYFTASTSVNSPETQQFYHFCFPDRHISATVPWLILCLYTASGVCYGHQMTCLDAMHHYVTWLVWVALRFTSTCAHNYFGSGTWKSFWHKVYTQVAVDFSFSSLLPFVSQFPLPLTPLQLHFSFMSTWRQCVRDFIFMFECLLKCSKCLSCCSPTHPLSLLGHAACIKMEGLHLCPPVHDRQT